MVDTCSDVEKGKQEKPSFVNFSLKVHSLMFTVKAPPR